jgi:hypothetical protein
MATTHSDELSHSPASSRVIAIIICSLNNKYTIIIFITIKIVGYIIRSKNETLYDKAGSLIYIQGNSRVMMS